MTTALVPVHADDLALNEAVEAALSRIEEIKLALDTLDGPKCAQLRAWAKGLNAMAQAKQARTLAVAACAVQVRAERRLGRFLLDGTLHASSFGLEGPAATVSKKLARMPDAMFESLITKAEAGSRSFSAQWLYDLSRRKSLEVSVPPFISRAWDGTYFIDVEGKRHWRSTLADARALVQEVVGLAGLASDSPPALLASVVTDAERLGAAIRAAMQVFVDDEKEYEDEDQSREYEELRAALDLLDPYLATAESVLGHLREAHRRSRLLPIRNRAAA